MRLNFFLLLHRVYAYAYTGRLTPFTAFDGCLHDIGILENCMMKVGVKELITDKMAAM